MLPSETLLSRSASRWAAGAALAAISVVACLAYLAGGRAGIGTAQRDYAFSPADDVHSQVMLPALDVPLGQPPTASTMAARFSLFIARGRRTALRDLAAVTAAAAIAAFGAALGGAGVAVFPTALAMIGMAAGATFWSRGVSWNADALSPALALMAMSGLWRWLSTRSGVGAVIAIVAGMAAMAEDRAWLATLPGLAVFLWSRLESPVDRGSTLAAIAALAALGAAVGQGPVLLAGRPSPGEMVAGLSGEFTRLGAFLTVVGLGALLQSKTARLPAMVTTMSLVIWYAATPRSPLEFVSIPWTIAGWAAIAVALAWILEVLSVRTGLALATAAAVMLVANPALTRGRLWELGRDLPSTLSARMAFDLSPADIPDNAALVSESRRVDAAILLSSKQAGRNTMIVPQSPDRLLAEARHRRPVFAFARARAHLERLGFMFEREWIGNAGTAVLLGHAPCVALTPGEWRDVSPLLAAGSFILHGGAPGEAPGGAVVRLLHPDRPRVATIEPRSIPFAIIDPQPGSIAVRVSKTGRTDPVIVTLDSAPASATATAEDASPVTLCQGILRAPMTVGRSNIATVRMDDSAPFLAGWHPVEADPDLFRWTAAPDALLSISVAPPGPIRITITATPAARAAQDPRIALRVNSCRLDPQPLREGQGDYEWFAGEPCWRAGMNQLAIGVTPLVSPAALFASHDTRLLGARIGAIRLSRVPADQKAK